jgi:hypothetical protein
VDVPSQPSAANTDARSTESAPSVGDGAPVVVGPSLLATVVKLGTIRGVPPGSRPHR